MNPSTAAIREVTQFLRSLLLRQLQVEGIANPQVTLLPPGNALPNTNGANLYLYRVVECPSTKNQDWRGNQNLPPSKRPWLGLQLYYLVTPLAQLPVNNDADEAHASLGAVMLALQEFPILNDVHLPELKDGSGIKIAIAVDADALPDYLRESYEKLKVTLLPTTVDEISRIWATLNQPYRLSVAYELSLVELIPSIPTPAQGGIVLSTNVEVITLDPPRLNSLIPEVRAVSNSSDQVGGSLTANDLQILGFGLSFPGQKPVVRVGGKLVAIKDDPPPTDQALSIALPTDLDAGPQVDVNVTLNGRTSTALSLTILPWLARTSPIRTALDPTIEVDRKLKLVGNGFSTPPRKIRFDGPSDTPRVMEVATFNDPGTEKELSIDIPSDLENGLYEVRVVNSDGATSNKRTLEIVPFIAQSIVVELVPTSNSDLPHDANGNPKNVHKLTLTGKRLDCADLRLVIDGVTYVAESNNTPEAIVYELGRPLDAGKHQLVVKVDGYTSRTIEFTVT